MLKSERQQLIDLYLLHNSTSHEQRRVISKHITAFNKLNKNNPLTIKEICQPIFPSLFGPMGLHGLENNFKKLIQNLHYNTQAVFSITTLGDTYPLKANVALEHIQTGIQYQFDRSNYNWCSINTIIQDKFSFFEQIPMSLFKEVQV